MDADDQLAVPSRSRRRQHLLVVALWIAVIGGYQLWSIRSGVGPGETARRLVDAVQGSAWGPIALIGAYVLRPLLLFPATVLTVAAGYLFGVGLGLAVVVVAANASAMFAYAIGRWFADERLVDDGGGRLRGYAHRMRARGLETTLILRLLLLPFDLVSYLAGFLRIRPLSFLTGTALGSLPSIVAFVLFGASIKRFDGGVPSINLRTLGASIALLVVSLALVRVIRRREGPGDAVH